MPYIFLPVPPYFQKHLEARMLEREMPNSDIDLLQKWLAGAPNVPAGSWCGKLPSGWKIVGKDYLPNSTLKPSQSCHKNDVIFDIK